MPLRFKDCCRGFPQRWIIAAMGFLAFFNAYTLRVCLSMAITQMVVPLNKTKQHSIDETCPDYRDHSLKNTTPISPKGTFEWDEYTQGIILSSFYWGYVLSHIPGGLLAEKYGPKYIIGLGVVITAILTLLTPAATVWGDAPAMITLRFFMGLCEGVIQPAMSSLLAQWIPHQERAFISSFVYAGVTFGIMVSSLVSGLIMARLNNSWHLIFYLFGGFGVLWFFFWIVLVSDSPKNNKFITKQEKDYLKEYIEKHFHDEKPPFPWRHALTSKPFLALILMRSGVDYCSYTVMSDIPKYFNDVLKLPVEMNGYVNSLHHISSWIYCFSASWVSDKLIKTEKTSRTVVRKVNTAIASAGPGVLMISAMYAGCDVILVLSLITIGLTLTGSNLPGSKINVLDLSPNYAGTLMGISNGVGAICGIIAPYIVGVLAPNQTISEWRQVFWIVSVVYLITTLNFLFFASGEVQPCNDPKFSTKKSSKSSDSEEETTLMKLDRFKLPDQSSNQ